ncbi:PRC-barrel domain-containing protein [Streptomyces pratensis]|uniref:PRC-barrel domain-containing protein n=1 Tax=Streptomyces pratensis TaxID=1169025 RepID=UPI00301B5932
MESGGIPVMTRLSDSPHVIASPEEDIRGRKVIDRSGNELGKIGDLVIDEEGQKVRFLVLEHGGFLGLGEKKSYVPVDAVAEVGEDEVRIDRTRDEVTESPAYDPDLAEPEDYEDYYGRLYTHYGYTPFWVPGYMYPRLTP